MDQNVLLDLDALMDTRLPSVARVSPEAAAKLMTDYYWERTSDDFEKYTDGLITNKQFLASYAKRDKDTLRGALVTGVGLMLTKMFLELCDQRINSPLVSEVTLSVNFWPYRLNKDEIEAYLTNVAVLVNNEVKLQSVWLPPKTITPVLLQADYSAYITYDFNEWMTAQQENFVHQNCPSVTVFAPARSAVKDLTEEDCQVPGHGYVSPFEALEAHSKLYMDLHLLRMELFSPVR